MRQVLGRANSSNVMKVIWLLEELGLPYERKDIGGAFGGNDTPEYRALNPNGVVPTLVEDDFVLWESNAILRYLAAAHPGRPPLLAARPAGARRYRPLDGLAADHAGRADDDVFWGLIRTPPEKRDMAAIDKAAGRLGELYGFLDNAARRRGLHRRGRAVGRRHRDRGARASLDELRGHCAPGAAASAGLVRPAAGPAGVQDPRGRAVELGGASDAVRGPKHGGRLQTTAASRPSRKITRVACSSRRAATSRPLRRSVSNPIT